jgi:hypothetical protein
MIAIKKCPKLNNIKVVYGRVFVRHTHETDPLLLAYCFWKYKKYNAL